MLEVKRAVLCIEEHEIIELERVILDNNQEEALRFLKKSVYEKILHSQQGKLKSHLESDNNPVIQFTKDNK